MSTLLPPNLCLGLDFHTTHMAERVVGADMFPGPLHGSTVSQKQLICMMGRQVSHYVILCWASRCGHSGQYLQEHIMRVFAGR